VTTTDSVADSPGSTPGGQSGDAVGDAAAVAGTETDGPVAGAEVAVRTASDAVPLGAGHGRLDDSQRAALDATAQRLPPLRRDNRVGKPARNPQWLVNQLPVGMLQSDFFVRFVSIFQELAGSLLDGADQVEFVPDGTVTPVPLVGHLGTWIGVDTIDASLPEELQRLILRSSSKALAHRGTIKGLQGYLEMLSGEEAEVTDGGGIWVEGDAPDDYAWVRMSVQGTGHLSEDEFVALVRDEVPAHVRAELRIAGRRVLSTWANEPTDVPPGAMDL
jgi:phage tail-like protein